MAAAVYLAGGVAHGKQPPNISVDLGRRHRPVEHQRLYDRLVGYRTPSIDRIADEGMIFTYDYGEPSCTAGRASFIIGRSVFRTGLSKVGLPGAELGMRKQDPAIANTYVIMLSAKGQQIDRERGLLGGADEYMTKPFSPREVAQRVRDILAAQSASTAGAR